MRALYSLRALLLLSLAVLGYACADLLHPVAPAGPSSLALSLSYAAQSGTPGLAAAAYDKADRVRVRVLREAAVAKDTVLDFAAAGAETRVRLPLDAQLARAPLSVEVELLRGAAPLFRGAAPVTLQDAGTTVASVPLSPVAARVILPDAVAPFTALGASVQLSGTALFATDDTIPEAPLAWSTPDAGVVEVGAGGLVVARTAGQARVVASLGAAADTVAVVVSPRAARITVVPSTLTLLVGASQPLAAAVVDANGNTLAGHPVAWSSSAPAVATVSAGQGVVAALATGRAAITASSDGVSGSATAEVQNPAPALSQLSPARAVAGSGALLLAVTGSGFVSASQLYWNGAARQTQFVSGTELRVNVSAADLARAGAAAVVVVTPAPGGGSSNPASFSIENPSPTVAGLDPNTAVAGGDGLTLAVRGEGFAPTSVVRWNGVARATNFVDATQLRATIPASDLASVAPVLVSVSTPAPGGGTSNSVAFALTNPAPTITRLDPGQVTAGRTDAFELLVTGSGFAPGAVVRWRGVARATNFVSPTQLRATISASDVAAAGTAPVTVFNPEPGGGSSNAFSFTIANPLPSLARIQPDTVVAGSGAFTLTVTGSGFVAGSVVRWNGASRTTRFVSATQLTASIPASDVAEAGSAAVTVFTPAPGGGSSRALAVTIRRPPALHLSRTQVSFTHPAAPQQVSVTNDGDGTLGGLAATVRYVGPTGWLQASLDRTTAPATLTLQATRDTLPQGTYEATVSVGSPAAGNSPQTVRVSFTVPADFSYWRAEGNYLDSGTAGNTGTPTGEVSFSASGFTGRAFEFFGPGSPGEINAPDGGGIGSSTRVTLAAWVRLDAEDPGTGVRRFVTLQPERAVLRLDGQFGHEQGAGANSLHFYISTFEGRVGIYADGALASRGCWYHVAATYDGSTARLYRNGVQVASTAFEGTLVPGNGEGIRLSNADGSGIETLQGLLDEVRVYARAASASEIAAWAATPGNGPVCP